MSNETKTTVKLGTSTLAAGQQLGKDLGAWAQASAGSRQLVGQSRPMTPRIKK